MIKLVNNFIVGTVEAELAELQVILADSFPSFNYSILPNPGNDDFPLKLLIGVGNNSDSSSVGLLVQSLQSAIDQVNLKYI